MADDLVERIRAEMPARGVSEQRMFGGTCFMLNGNMVAASSPRGVLLRVGKEQHAAAIRRGSARPMERNGKPLEGYIYVDPAALAARATLRSWLDLAIAYVRTLPPKEPKAVKAKR